jgi:toxin ParE1/3/4
VTLPVAYAPQAKQDLDDLFRYIASESPNNARTYTSELAGQCLRLGAMPEMGRLRHDLGEGLRSFSFRRRQVIIYEILPDRVEILRIFSAGQDVQALLD